MQKTKTICTQIIFIKCTKKRYFIVNFKLGLIYLFPPPAPNTFHTIFELKTTYLQNIIHFALEITISSALASFFLKQIVSHFICLAFNGLWIINLCFILTTSNPNRKQSVLVHNRDIHKKLG